MGAAAVMNTAAGQDGVEQCWRRPMSYGHLSASGGSLVATSDWSAVSGERASSEKLISRPIRQRRRSGPSGERVDKARWRRLNNKSPATESRQLADGPDAGPYRRRYGRVN